MALRPTISVAPRAVELFAGAGLLGHAFATEGVRLVHAIELETAAAATYAHNLGNHIEVADVAKATPSGRCDVLLAGPPCQGFSTLGKRYTADPRNKLCLQVARWAAVLRPKVIVVENVAAFVGSFHWSLLRGRLRRLGYEVESTVLDAADFSVPQHRLRSFTFATKSKVPIVVPPRNAKPFTVREAWEGLPAEPNGQKNHVAPTPTALALGRMKLIGPGGDKRDVMRAGQELCPASWAKIPSEVTDVWGRILWEEPANTVRTCFLNPSKGRYIHPEQNRVISLREAARLQSVPDEFEFLGKPYQIARQIGNGVPTLLGRAVARAVLSSL